MVNQKEIKLSNLDRVLWPGENYTKKDLIRYYIQVARYLLPHLKERPLVVQRFPGSIEESGFYQKNIPVGAPEWLQTISITHQDGKETNYIIPCREEELIWLGNQACLELHPWLSSVSTLDYPDFAVFDLDPMEKTTFNQVREAALVVNEILSSLGLHAYPKFSGATGIQIYLPIEPVHRYRQVRDFVELICRQVHRQIPQHTTLERIIEGRRGKLYLDYLQNVQGKTLAAPYSPRPLPGAPVSMPLSWKEVAEGFYSPGDFTINTAPVRLRERGDLFAAVLREKQNLPQLL